MMKQHNDPSSRNGRRTFLAGMARLAGTSLVLSVPGIGRAMTAPPARPAYTVRQVIERIWKEVPGAPFATTVDQLRAGSMDQEVTGIVTTMFPTLAVIEQAARAGANLIIAHETPFYNNADETDWLQGDDAYRYKVDLLRKHNMAVWRFHDYWHAHKPDGIIMGNLIKLGWETHFNAQTPRLLTLPQPLALGAIVDRAKQRLGISTVRVAGNLQQECRTLYLAFGYMDSKRQIAALQEHQPDLILSGETREWETVERVRDGLLMGKKTALLVLGHSVSEEAGMEYAARWLQPKLPGVAVRHIASTDPFMFM
ncbi:MAG TPA: Nif3-like dinuclear metal center hexameric protein [Chitinophagaceae bacterium]|nr:Nif3-like dinuclear metal center hexameric protein [Chitinophagaceae bacterium]